MGLVILCNPVTTVRPYQMELTATNLYSIEELCYYLYENLYLLEDSNLDEQLVKWIEQELKMPHLAQCLLQVLHAGESKKEFVKMIFEKTGYCDEYEMKYVVDVLEKMEQVTPFERAKIRADRLLENHNYAKGILEYKKMLDAPMAKNASPKLCGNIYHNMGAAYARMFLFSEAAECFEKAYALNFNPESYREQMVMMEQLKQNVMKEERQDIKEAFQIRIDEMEQSAYDTEFEKERSLLKNWKMEYRKMNQRG